MRIRITFVVLGFLSGCNNGLSSCPPSPRTNAGDGTKALHETLTWTDYDGRADGADPDQVQYWLDGFSFGREVPGFRAVLNKLRQLPMHSIVTITWTESRTGPGKPPYAPLFNFSD